MERSEVQGYKVADKGERPGSQPTDLAGSTREGPAGPSFRVPEGTCQG